MRSMINEWWQMLIKIYRKIIGIKAENHPYIGMTCIYVYEKNGGYKCLPQNLLNVWSHMPTYESFTFAQYRLALLIVRISSKMASFSIFYCSIVGQLPRLYGSIRYLEDIEIIKKKFFFKKVVYHIAVIVCLMHYGGKIRYSTIYGLLRTKYIRFYIDRFQG